MYLSRNKTKQKIFKFNAVDYILNFIISITFYGRQLQNNKILCTDNFYKLNFYGIATKICYCESHWNKNKIFMSIVYQA